MQIFSHYHISGDRDLFWYIFSYEKGDNLDGPLEALLNNMKGNTPFNC